MRCDGGVEHYPMKQWLREHPDQLPGRDPRSSTSHQLRGALKKKGWAVQETLTAGLTVGLHAGSDTDTTPTSEQRG